MALEILELASGIADLWFWFSLTGSCVVWVVTLGQVWLVDDHSHWAAVTGIILHVVVISAVVYFWGSGGGEKEKAGGAQAKPAAHAKAAS